MGLLPTLENCGASRGDKKRDSCPRVFFILVGHEGDGGSRLIGMRRARRAFRCMRGMKFHIQAVPEMLRAALVVGMCWNAMAAGGEELRRPSQHFQTNFVPSANLIKRKAQSHRKESMCGLRRAEMRLETGVGRRPSSVQMDQVELWMLDKKIQADGLEHVVLPKRYGDVRGVVAKRDLLPEETVIRLPRSAVLCVKGNEACPDPSLADFWDRYDKWYVRLGLKLLLEKRKGSKSAIWGYIRLLPDVDEVKNFPCEWDEELVEQLRCPSVITSVKKQQQVWREMVQEFPKLCPACDFSAEELRWSWHM
eukprot:767311-Hanusia_phi.AAC.1